MTDLDVLVIGAGPAGLAAAAAAGRRGARVRVVDAASGIGGQFWRHLPASRPAARQEVLNHDWGTFTGLAEQLPDDTRLRAQVWAIEPDGDRLVVRLEVADAGLVTLRPDRIVFATGAHDRALPVPGWTLPGVYTAGAAQALAKGERVALGDRVVVSGSGPFLLPVTHSLGQAGAEVAGVYEATGFTALAKGWGSRAWELSAASHKIGELSQYLSHLLRARIGYHLGWQVVEIHGSSRVEAVTVERVDAQWRPIAGTGRRVDCDTVCLGHGFTPRLELPIAAGCALTPDRFVAVDEGQRTSVASVLAAGEITAIGGAELALAGGEIAGWVAAGGDAADPQLAAARRRRAAALRFATRLEAVHGIRPGWQAWLRPDTVVCRCEEVTAGALAATARDTAADGLRSYKLTTRAGMGLCQGRVCGRNAEQLLLAHRDREDFADHAITDRRPIASPIGLAELAAADFEENNQRGLS